MQDTKEIDVRAVLAERRQIALIWSIEDVQGLRPDLTEEQAWEVLAEVKDQHDANWGVNWTTLEVTAQDLFGKAPKTDQSPREA